MNLAEVIEDLIYEKNLDKAQVLAVIADGLQKAYQRKFPDLDFRVELGKKDFQISVGVVKTVVEHVEDHNKQITLKRAKFSHPKAELGQELVMPFEEGVGRVDVCVAKQAIASGIRQLEQQAVFEQFKDRVGALISGTVHKKERSGYVISIGDVLAFLPTSCAAIDSSQVRNGYQIRCLVKEVLPFTETGYQVVLDRSGPDFVQRLMEMGIPEILKGEVDIVKIERVAGYKTKVAVVSRKQGVDPVGACIGLRGARIEPVVRELCPQANAGEVRSGERIELLRWTEDREALIKDCLRPAKISGVKVSEDGLFADVWLPEDQKAIAVGKQGLNVLLAHKITGMGIRIHQEEVKEQLATEGLFGESEQVDEQGLDSGDDR